ncbi:MAG: glucoamylase family protein, partial [Devosia sp.]
HLYNWYDTQDLRPLDPRYVSSVDSGNLAGHLIALANACAGWRGAANSPALAFEGIADAVELAREAAQHLRDAQRSQTVTWPQFDATLATLQSGLIGAASGSSAERLATLSEHAATLLDIVEALAMERGGDSVADLVFWARACAGAIDSHRRDVATGAEAAKSLDLRLATLESTARSTAMAMEFGFLLDEERRLLSIGYLVAEGLIDPNCYDLLASEARLASFVAIAKGDVPARHWFRLGRAAVPVGHSAALISWSGSMFEYLMPSLIMRAPADSLLAHTNRLIVRRQIAYATSLDLPWGISESAYNARDLEFTYQYSNFGVPGLGLKRGLADNRVIAPYATALATMVDPGAAALNLVRLEAEGALGRYGFYEALDYTAERLPKGHRVAIVRAFMAHHQGMTVVAIADALLDGVMRARFHAEPIVQATELLQERTPREVAITRPWAAEVKSGAGARAIEPPSGRRYATPDQSVVATHLLSNGRFATMLTAAGSGYSRWGNLAVTRWREDTTSDDAGSYVFLRDLQGGQVWSAGYQPTGVDAERYSVVFNEDRAEFVRRDGSLTTTMEVVVSSEDDAEVRRVSVSNTGGRTRDVEITSYAELALGPQADDVAHPAFAKMFVETEYLADLGAIAATRRRRTPTEPEIWAAHLAVVDGEAIGAQEIETDRARFLGRGNTSRSPIAAIDGQSLSGTVGTVLDPVFALRRRVRIAPGTTAHVAFWTMVSPTREALLDQIDKHRDGTAFERAVTLAWTQAQVQLYHLGITAGEAAMFQRLAGHIIYAGPTLRPSSDTIARGGGPQSGLWSKGISGDLPLLLLRISDADNLDLVHDLLRAHEYWRLKQLAVDLVILNERQSSYVQDLQIGIETLVRNRKFAPPAQGGGSVGQVFTLRTDTMPPETQALLASAARVVLVAQRGSLFDQLDRMVDTAAPRPVPRRAVRGTVPASPVDTSGLEFFNGLGGFANGGKEYVTVLGPGQSTPAPWINVVANAGFGFQVAAEGSGYTWSANSRENQLTPWSNDPVADHPGEAIYLRDDDTGDLWSPTASPIREKAATYVARHGRGHSRFELEAHGIASALTQYVPMEGSIKISRLVLRNRSGRPRTIDVTAYVEWVLGTSRSATLPFVATEIDAVTGAMFARNRWSAGFGSHVAFIDMAGRQTQWTGNRTEFIGRNGTLANPVALSAGRPMSKAVGAGVDPCGVLGTRLDLPANGSVEVVFFLGEATSADAARELITQYRGADLDAVEAEVANYWDDTLGAIQVKTPDRSMDIVLNGWLLYQTLVCRVWARSAFYQASGAYGFRDQLQDGMALVVARPALTREHLLRAAGRQFVEGDVQHWWLPHSGQGVRTRISDDRAWLAYTVAQYVETTGDSAILNEALPFLEGQALLDGEADNFFLPTIADRTATLFEHCSLALDHSLALGAHGLPLIGTGDWNDGMNRVGDEGKGESVWLGWFLYTALQAFIPLATRRSEKARAAKWRTHAATLKANLEHEAWDGDWYRRAFFDDGTPLGSAADDECRIDAIAQSWAVLSGAANPERRNQAMAAVERELMPPQDRLALLFAPPFDKTPRDPGYIKGYPPGIRENGGQYTHAALWSVLAFTALGEGDKAASLFSLLNPINRARTRADVHRYKVEPYVVAADIYARPPHVGRGGWTWYTGSAGWMYRLLVESLLGLSRSGNN